jgi:hypothetical protein
MAVYNTELFVGGRVTGVSTATSPIARWDGTSWQPVGLGIPYVPAPAVAAVTVYNGTLIAAGTSTPPVESPASRSPRGTGRPGNPLASVSRAPAVPASARSSSTLVISSPGAALPRLADRPPIGSPGGTGSHGRRSAPGFQAALRPTCTRSRSSTAD